VRRPRSEDPRRHDNSISCLSCLKVTYLFPVFVHTVSVLYMVWGLYPKIEVAHLYSTYILQANKYKTFEKFFSSLVTKYVRHSFYPVQVNCSCSVVSAHFALVFQIQAPAWPQ
jgi:hypothetical protein